MPQDKLWFTNGTEPPQKWDGPSPRREEKLELAATIIDDLGSMRVHVLPAAGSGPRARRRQRGRMRTAQKRYESKMIDLWENTIKPIIGA